MALTWWTDLLGGQPGVMGILNVTPDSFSDGGRFSEPLQAISAGLAMARAGAAIIDVGGESTRPGSNATSPEEEQSRVVPVVRGLAEAGVVVSVDTRNASTMAAVLDAGARIINDVSALAHDPDTAGLVATRRCAVILMHMRGSPATMTGLAHYSDLAVEVTGELAARVASAESAGISRDVIALDVGIGFAKGTAQNVEMLRRLDAVGALGFPLVVGVSRKGFIGRLAGEAEAFQRLGGSIAAGLFAVCRGAALLRVHDVHELFRPCASGARLLRADRHVAATTPP